MATIFATRGVLRRSDDTKIVFGRDYDAPLDPLVGWGGEYPLPIPHPVDAFSVSLLGAFIPWTDELRYLGVFIMRCRIFKCSLIHAKKSLYRSANAIFGKTERIICEHVTLHLIYSKCIPILLYGMEACPLTESDLSSLDFVLNSFMMKLFKTANIAVVDCCRVNFGLNLPSVLWSKRVYVNLTLSLLLLTITYANRMFNILWYSCCVGWLFI